MSELGALLRKAREDKQMSLDDLQEITKIRKRYLEAIESGDHNVLPGSFYTRAFIKNYAEAVDLNPDEVLSMHQNEVPPAPSVQQHIEPLAARPPRKVRTAKSERLGKIGFNIVVWCFIILIVAVVWYYTLGKDSKIVKELDGTSVTSESSQKPENEGGIGGISPSPSPSIAPTQEPEAITTVEFAGKAPSIKGADKYLIGPADKKHTLEITIKGGRAWVEIARNGRKGERLFYDTAEDGAVLAFEMTTPMTFVNVGRADYAEIKVDGVLVPDSDFKGKKLFLLELEQNDQEDVSSSKAPENAQ